MKKADNAIPNELLSYERERCHWTQEDVAEQVGIPDAKMVGRWERGITLPNPHYRKKLEILFGKSVRELGFPRKGEIPFWNVPHRQNLFFTGREDILTRLHTMLASHKTAALIPPQVLTGLGGVGKTQLAVEYAYRYREEYHTVAWIRADSQEVLTADFAALAELLNLLEKNDSDQNSAITAVKRWLGAMKRWLLIFDNATSLAFLHDFLPLLSHGHILLTTNASTTGTLAQAFEIDVMEPDEGTYFLLRRSKIVTSNAPFLDSTSTNRQAAGLLAHTLGYLPLALDQAGAYIEETTCGIQNYLQLYETRRKELLQRRGEQFNGHIEPVATTWSIAFNELARMNVGALEMLYLLAFLAPDAIPEEIITQDADVPESLFAPFAADPLLFNEAVKSLRKFSLIRRNPDMHLLTIHSLVQVVLQDSLTQAQQRQWAEQAVRAITRVFPPIKDEDSEWRHGERYFAQALKGAELIQQWDMQFFEASVLLYRIGNYLRMRGLYSQVERFYQAALEIRERLLGPEHFDVAEILDDIGTLYFSQGKIHQAEMPLYRALAIRKKLLNQENPLVAQSLFNLGLIRFEQERYEQAETLYRRALHIYRQTPETTQAHIAETLGELGFFYYHFEHYSEAEHYLQEAWVVCKNAHLEEHPALAIILNNLAGVYRQQKNYLQAETLLKHVIDLWERRRGPEHPDVAYGLSNLAKLYVAQENYAQAQLLYQRALLHFEKALGPESSRVKATREKLAEVYALQEKQSV